MNVIKYMQIPFKSRLLFRFAALIVPVILILTAAVYPFPRLSVEHGEACTNCHINPNGGGARTEYANFSVGFNELCLPQTKKLVASHYKKPRIGESLVIGFDTRHLLLDNGSVFRMQTDAFVTVQPLKSLFYHLRFGATSGITENYALLYFHDQRYYVKAGHFYPAFGLRNEDHTAFNRTATGNTPSLYLDGVSLGAEVSGFNIAAELFDQLGQGIYGLHIYRAGALGQIGYMAGASLRYSERVDGSYLSLPHAKALFGGLSYNRFTATGEFDLVESDNRRVAAYANLTTRLEYGCYLVAEYNFHNLDRRLSGNTGEFARFSLELYPLPFVQVRPSYTVYSEPTDNTVNGKKNQFFLQVHFGY